MVARKPPDESTGWDFARCTRALTADVPIIFMSGGSGQEWIFNGVTNSVLFAKPFAIGQIITAFSQMLNAGGATIAEHPLT